MEFLFTQCGTMLQTGKESKWWLFLQSIKTMAFMFTKEKVNLCCSHTFCESQIPHVFVIERKLIHVSTRDETLCHTSQRMHWILTHLPRVFGLRWKEGVFNFRWKNEKSIQDCDRSIDSLTNLAEDCRKARTAPRSDHGDRDQFQRVTEGTMQTGSLIVEKREG